MRPHIANFPIGLQRDEADCLPVWPLNGVDLMMNRFGFTSKDPDETAAHIKEKIGLRVQVQPLPGAKFDMRMLTKVSGSLKLSTSEFANGMKISSDLMPDNISVFITESGQHSFRYKKYDLDVLENEVMIGNISLAPIATMSPGLKHHFTSISISEATAFIERVTEKRFIITPDIMTIIKPDQNINHTLRSLFSAIDSHLLASDGNSNPYALRLMYDALWITALQSVPAVRDRMTGDHKANPAPWQIRRAMDFIAAQPQPITINEVAEAIGIGVRALQLGFKKHLNMKPHDYIKKIRLQAVKREICDFYRNEPIHEIAKRWGFSNKSRFMAEYKELFGEMPSRSNNI